ncbi:hypothetical protein MHM88_11190 [Epibacterium sp. MM17-32]|uniref:hypothetical protein n=1 Tax=Epibacterium sp. MM17-32 TaxID=2917734 RepID=UPI001EF589A4|nr:hypothetical protein [Epibacterium sp. MM17-32]MCG7628372.1 hypothetical protein [Epibacterium sp. MM17-32]
MPKKKLTPRQRAIAAGYRSGLEQEVAAEYEQLGVSVEYEQDLIRYTVPARSARYTPDFVQPNGIIIETKGRFETKDRQKHLLIQKEHPDLDIRFVFSNPKTRIAKKSLTTYADWCEKHGFRYAHKRVPEDWVWEATNPRSIEALQKAGLK